MIHSRRLLVVLFVGLVLLIVSGLLIRSQKDSRPGSVQPSKTDLCEKEGVSYSEGALVKAPDGGILRCHLGRWVEAK